MESTARTAATTTTSEARTVTPGSLIAAFATVPDPRRVASVTYPLPTVLALAVAALLCAHVTRWPSPNGEHGNPRICCPAWG
jgi:hypothetical protein